MIKKGSRVSIEYTLKLDDGSVADSNVGREPLVYQHGQGEILPALENHLEELDVKQTKKVTLSPEEAYGPVNPELFKDVDPATVPEKARHCGAQLVAEDGTGRKYNVRVSEVHDDKIVVDLNHKLAGERLHFDVKVLAIE